MTDDNIADLIWSVRGHVSTLSHDFKPEPDNTIAAGVEGMREREISIDRCEGAAS